MDEKWMLRAIEIGQKARVHAPPNPWVGAIIVKNGKAVGEGYSFPAGGPHAEVNALRMAKENAKGATVYVSLEPCSHQGRTPPCVDALIRAKVARVVIACEDPDPRVSGRGISALRQAGIITEVGVKSEEAARCLEPYLYQRKTKLPFCVLKAAVSVDGRTAAADRSSQWITSPAARQDAHRLRSESQAIVIGANTALYDTPSLTVRDATLPPCPPLRVLLDAKGKVPPLFPLFDSRLAPTLVFTTKLCSPERQDEWRAAGAEVEIIEEAKEGVDLKQVVDFLGQRGILQMLVEGGATLLGSFLKSQLAKKLVIYIGPKIIGDSGVPLFAGFAPSSLEDALSLRLSNTRLLDDSVCLTYRL